MVKLHCDDATYERMKLHRYRYNKMLEELEQIDRGIGEAVTKGDKEGEALLKQERVYLIKAKNSLDEYVKFLEASCFVGNNK
jgi:uncharacterized protein YdcH (DUF465 family)